MVPWLKEEEKRKEKKKKTEKKKSSNVSVGVKRWVHDRARMRLMRVHCTWLNSNL